VQFRRILIGLAAVFILLGHECGTSAKAQVPETRWLCMPTPNRDMTYILYPNSDFMTLGVPFRTNELGFRDRPIAEKASNMFRILCVGDSVTFGTGVANEETFPNLLEARLQQSAPAGKAIDVINAGVSAYNIRNIKGLLSQHLGTLRPDIVIYVFVENDLDDSVSPSPDGYLVAYDPAKSQEDPFIGDDFAGMWVIHRDAVKKKGLFGKLAGFFDNEFNRICELPPPLLLGQHPETRSRWAAFTQHLDEIKSLCDRTGTPFLVYAFALKGHSEPVVLRVKEICEARSIPFATTMPVFSYATYAKRHSLGYDPHCNPEGHRLMADRLLSFLVESQSLTSAFIGRKFPVTRYDDSVDLEASRSLEAQSLAAPALINIDQGKGAIGLLGGLDVEGRMARSCLLRLGGQGNTIEVEVSALVMTPEQPQSISATIEGHPVGQPIIVPQSPVRCFFPIPETFWNQPVEVEIIAHGQVRLPTMQDRQHGATPQTVRIHRVERLSRQEGI
jgi:lysophospholipase L1-like esterase